MPEQELNLLKQGLRYFRIFLFLFKTSFIAELEFRANMTWKFVTDVIWYLIQLALYEVLYQHTPQIAGWTHSMMRVFLGCVFLSDALYMMLFASNFDQFTDRVRKGELDLILAKPVNSQFMTSFYRMQPTYLANWFLALGWTIWSLIQQKGSFNGRDLILLLIVTTLGAVVMYSLRFIMLTFTIGMGRAESLMQFWYVLYRFSFKPDFFYPPWLSQLLKTALPMAFISSVPAHLILNLRPLEWLAYLFGLAFGFLYLSQRFWSKGIRGYSSASS